MIHIIPDFGLHKNWTINKCRSIGSFNEQFSNIIDYVSRATLASIPEFKQKPLIITFHRVYPRQMKTLSGGSSALFCIRKRPIEGPQPYKLGSIYICTAFLDSKAIVDDFSRIVVRGILKLANIESTDKENEILRLFR